MKNEKNQETGKTKNTQEEPQRGHNQAVGRLMQWTKHNHHNCLTQGPGCYRMEHMLENRFMVLERGGANRNGSPEPINSKQVKITQHYNLASGTE